MQKYLMIRYNNYHKLIKKIKIRIPVTFFDVIKFSNTTPQQGSFFLTFFPV